MCLDKEEFIVDNGQAGLSLGLVHFGLCFRILLSIQYYQLWLASNLCCVSFLLQFLKFTKAKLNTPFVI